MVEYNQSYCLWALVFVHCISFIECVYVCLFKREQHSQVFDISPNSDNGKNSYVGEDKEEFVFMKFPKMTLRVFYVALKV